MATRRVFEVDSNPISRKSRLVDSLKSGLLSAPEVRVPDGLFGFSAIIETAGVVLESTDFDFEFEIPFDDDLVPNESTITIYNLTAATIGCFKVGGTFTITAGYGTDVGVILSGKISTVRTYHDGADKVTEITVLDNADYTNSELVETAYSEGTAASTILRTLLSRLGLSIAVFKTQRDHTYTNAVTVSGSITDAIKTYADVCGCRVYVCKQQIYCRPRWDGDDTKFSVCADTGLIDSPEPFSESTTSEEYTDTITGYEWEMLLQHRMTTAALVDVSARDTSGRYRVIEGTHSYDGLSAVTKIKAIENISTVVKVETTTTTTSSTSSSSSSSSVASKVVSIAEGEIGTKETGDNQQKYGKALGMNGVAWCGIFVAWCIKQAGVGLPSFNYAVAKAYAYAAQHSGWGTYHAKGGSYTPKRGDIFVKNYDGTASTGGHVGFVRAVSGSSFTTVEGNSSDMVKSNTRSVSEYTFVTPPY